MIVKAKEEEDYLPSLRQFLQRLRRGIDVDPSKIKAILEMEPPKSEKGVRSFLGKVQFISRFISKLTLTCEPLFRLLKKGVPFEWTEKCQVAFESIQRYLQSLPAVLPIELEVPSLRIMVESGLEESEWLNERQHASLQTTPQQRTLPSGSSETVYKSCEDKNKVPPEKGQLVSQVDLALRNLAYASS
ncbi:uncharacterized protein LOC131306866 [Rhododendron vialii]|uniref:uncharacterized protein LOC131306866 n=1 Tax=Rhododendron vialii TaxID=182163 RepID=UPI00265DAE2B|nr:uncharacterized protein LOC131306866 [Rhododendron vialii]